MGVLYNVPGIDTDRAGRTSVNTIFGERSTTQPVPDVAIRWPYNINTIENVTTTSGSGTVATDNDLLNLNSGTTAGSVSRLASVGLIRYRPGSEIYWWGTTIFTATGTPGSQEGIDGLTQAVGIFNSDNGFAVGFNGVQFGIRWRVSGVDTWIPSSQFNRDTLQSLDLTQIQLWRISFGWLGATPIFFEYLTTDGLLTCFHVIPIANTISTSSIHNPSMPASAELVSTTSTTNGTLKVGCMEGGASHAPESHVGYRLFGTDSGAIAISSSAVTPLLSLQVVSTFQGKTNRANAKLLGMTATLSNTSPAVTNVLATFRLIYNGTLTGASFSNIDATNSVVQYDNSATAISYTTAITYSISCPVSFSQNVNLEPYGIEIYPGQLLTVGVLGEGSWSGNLLAAVSLNWREQY